MTQAPIDFFASALQTDSAVTPTAEALEWIRRRNEEVHVEVKEVPLNQLQHWYTEEATGNLRHQSGRFFSIEGVRIKTNAGLVNSWSQPIIHQPEIGYLGFLVKKIDGILHFLVQAKIEPGNVNCVQLSPTIQATRSNYTQVHKGRQPAYLEYFKERRGHVLIDQLQSEQGARFFRKRNRNIIIEVTEELPLQEDFRWLTLGQIKALLRQDNVVNMDTRTVISGIHYGQYPQGVIDLLKVFSPALLSGFHEQLFYSYTDFETARHSFGDLLSWLTELKSAYELEVSLMPLKEVSDWQRDDFRIYHREGKYFEVIGVEVAIGNREVTRWCQPIVKPCQEGLVAFVAREINGRLHFLVQAKLEVGNLDIVELAPTVQCITGNYRKGLNEYDVPYLDYVLNARREQVKFDVLLSEEGGRFYKNQNRNMVILAGDEFQETAHPNYRWMTLHQIMRFVEYNNFLNIEARSLLSMLSFR